MTQRTRYDLKAILRGLIDGTGPLPRPHPQRLPFPTRGRMFEVPIDFVGILLDNLAFDLSEIEAWHLLFKAAAYVLKRGLRPDFVQDELWHNFMAVEMVIHARRDWLTSRAGLSWCFKRFDAWQGEMRRLARDMEEEPRAIAVVLPGFQLVELTNAKHIFAEGQALGHCMSWSVSVASLRKRGYPTGEESLECLTYAVKLRSRELRLFSLRNRHGSPVMTISYARKRRAIDHIHVLVETPCQFPYGPGVMRCAVVSALSKIVPINDVVRRVDHICGLRCPKGDWCKGEVPPWRGVSEAARVRKDGAS